MPNHVTSMISMKGITKLDLFKKENNHKEFDFNKIIPMPEELHVESSSEADNGLYIYCLCNTFFNGEVEHPTATQILEAFTLMSSSQIKIGESNAKMAVQKNSLFFPHFIDIERIKSLIDAIKKGEELDRLISLYEKGKAYYSNVEKYGFADWYHWSIANWGTKWNAYETQILDGDTIMFDTAWAAPLPIIEALSKKYWRVPIYIKYADEDMGSNTGNISFLAGKPLLVIQPDTRSQEAYAIYVSVKGESDCLTKDEAGKYYPKDCGECGLCK